MLKARVCVNFGVDFVRLPRERMDTYSRDALSEACELPDTLDLLHASSCCFY